MKFRTITDLQDYCDFEDGFPPSQVDLASYEPLETTIKRFERCGGIPSFEGEYDEGDPEKLLDDDDPIEDRNLDLADITELEQKAIYAQMQLNQVNSALNNGKGDDKELSDTNGQKSSPESSEATL